MAKHPMIRSAVSGSDLDMAGLAARRAAFPVKHRRLPTHGVHRQRTPKAPSAGIFLTNCEIKS
jgi:hypothetical protein